MTFVCLSPEQMFSGEPSTDTPVPLCLACVPHLVDMSRQQTDQREESRPQIRCLVRKPCVSLFKSLSFTVSSGLLARLESLFRHLSKILASSLFHYTVLYYFQNFKNLKRLQTTKTCQLKLTAATGDLLSGMIYVLKINI